MCPDRSNWNGSEAIIARTASLKIQNVQGGLEIRGTEGVSNAGILARGSNLTSARRASLGFPGKRMVQFRQPKGEAYCQRVEILRTHLSGGPAASPTQLHQHRGQMKVSIPTAIVATAPAPCLPPRPLVLVPCFPPGRWQQRVRNGEGEGSWRRKTTPRHGGREKTPCATPTRR
jgi:hypothetical protein